MELRSGLSDGLELTRASVDRINTNNVLVVIDLFMSYSPHTYDAYVIVNRARASEIMQRLMIGGLLTDEIAEEVARL